jgi:flagellar biosynthesis protein FlhG
MQTRVISVTSGKGGVGKTHTTVNLGLALIKQGKKVLLLDADLGLANINVILGFEAKRNLKALFDEQLTLEEIIVHHESGLDIIPASSGVSELTNLSEAERLQLIDAVDELASKYDYLLIDTAAGIGDNVIYFNLAAEEIIVVVDEEPTSITDAYALMKVLSTQHGVKSFSILANRINDKQVDGRSVYSQLAKPVGKFLEVKLRYLGAVPNDNVVTQAVRAQKPYFQLYPSSQASLHIAKVADKLEKERFSTTTRTGGGLQFFFKSIVEESRG